jgi:hypothetical protein
MFHVCNYHLVLSSTERRWQLPSFSGTYQVQSRIKTNQTLYGTAYQSPLVSQGLIRDAKNAEVNPMVERGQAATRALSKRPEQEQLFEQTTLCRKRRYST